MFEYVGAAHVHSKYSDGTGTVEEIALIADEVGLDYVLLTDHNTLRALDENKEKWYGNTLLLVGTELNDKNIRNHYLAFNISKTLSTRISAEEYVQEVKAMGGFGFIAHPHEKRSTMEEHPPYPWTEWGSEDFNGIEIWNHMSEWMEGLNEQNKYNRFVHPLSSINHPPKETLAVWDKLNRKRKVVGIGGVDAHAHKINLLGFLEVEVFPYKVLFKSIRTHVFTEDKINIGFEKMEVDSAKQQIYSALKNGRSFISNFYHGDAKGFRFFAEHDKINYQMGDLITAHKNVIFHVMLPNVSGTINLIHNGKLIDSVNNYDAEFICCKEGAYRIEVYKEDKAWIYSNHIRIGSEVC